VLYWILKDLEAIPTLKQWSKITAIACVESQRTEGLKTITEKRYYLPSLSLTAQQFAEVVRGHGGIENWLHWVLDVAFREDQSKVTQGYAPENLAVLRHIALNLLTHEKSIKAGTCAKRMRAGWDDQYLFKVLSNATHSKAAV
jgi:predicted transposase YbfD/YdcC